MLPDSCPSLPHRRLPIPDNPGWPADRRRHHLVVDHDNAQIHAIDEFLDGISVLDAPIAERSAAADRENCVLKYVVTVRPEGEISVGIAPVSRTTVLVALQGPENVVSFRTARYDRYPMVISGPGAGAPVTAAGMIGDMLELASMSEW